MASSVKHSLCTAYADDTNLICTSSRADLPVTLRNLEMDYKSLSNWCYCNSLKLNPEKTEYLAVYNPILQDVPDLSIKIDGKHLKPSKSIKILGVVIDQQLLFEEHVQKVSAKLTGFIRTLSSRRKAFPRRTLKILMNSYVKSRIHYCISTIGISTTAVQDLEKCQNFAIRTIYGLPKFEHISVYRNELQWMRIAQASMYNLGLIIYKQKHSERPGYLNLDLGPRLPHDRFPRRHRVIRRDLHNNRYGEMTFTDRAICLLTSTPPEMWN